MQPYYVRILKSEHDPHHSYASLTEDLTKRLKTHSAAQSEAAAARRARQFRTA